MVRLSGVAVASEPPSHRAIGVRHAARMAGGENSSAAHIRESGDRRNENGRFAHAWWANS